MRKFSTSLAILGFLTICSIGVKTDIAVAQFPQGGSSSSPKEPRMYNLEVAVADTEYAWTIPTGTTKMYISARNADIRYNIDGPFQTSDGATPEAYILLPQEFVRCTGIVSLSPPGNPNILYYQSADTNAVVEITAYR